jgi:amidase
MTENLWKLSATETARQIKEGSISCEAVMTSHLERLNQTRSLNAVTTRFDDDAIKTAREADTTLKTSNDVGPLHGVPITIKENTDQLSRATSHGVLDFEDRFSSDDSPLVKKLINAGAIPLGRTNSPEFAWRFHTENELFGATLNPWNAELSPGGSSGGAASSVAVGVGCIAQGNDLGGSIRGPSYCCGITGIKPTQGRVAFYNDTSLTERPITIQLASVQGPLARNVADAKLAYEVMLGHSSLDTWSLPNFTIERPEIKKIALVKDPICLGIHPAVSEALDAAADAFIKAGYPVEIATPPSLKEINETYMRLMFTEMHLVKDAIVNKFGSGQIKRVLNHYMQIGKPFDLAGYAGALSRRSHFHREWDQFQLEYPIILTPMLTTPPYRAGQDMESVEAMEEMIDAACCMAAMNYLDLPAMSVPTNVRELNIPIGVQVIGPRYGEDCCFEAAQVLEDAFGCPSDELLDLT